MEVYWRELCRNSRFSGGRFLQFWYFWLVYDCDRRTYFEYRWFMTLVMIESEGVKNNQEKFKKIS